jgi:hypothetical protein
MVATIADELAQHVTATVNGKTRRMTTGQAIAKRIVGLAAGGNLRAAEILLKLAPGSQADQGADTPANRSNPNEDEAVLNRHMARMITANSGRKDGDNE